MSSLDERSQETLDKIVDKTVTELADHEIGFLRARVSYLNGDQLKKFDSVLKHGNKPAKKDEPKSDKNDEKLSYKELQAEATKLGISPVVGVSGEELKALIAEAK